MNDCVVKYSKDVVSNIYNILGDYKNLNIEEAQARVDQINKEYNSKSGLINATQIKDKKGFSDEIQKKIDSKDSLKDKISKEIEDLEKKISSLEKEKRSADKITEKTKLDENLKTSKDKFEIKKNVKNGFITEIAQLKKKLKEGANIKIHPDYSEILKVVLKYYKEQGEDEKNIDKKEHLRIIEVITKASEEYAVDVNLNTIIKVKESDFEKNIKTIYTDLNKILNQDHSQEDIVEINKKYGEEVIKDGKKNNDAIFSAAAKYVKKDVVLKDVSDTPLSKIKAEIKKVFQGVELDEKTHTYTVKDKKGKREVPFSVSGIIDFFVHPFNAIEQSIKSSKKRGETRSPEELRADWEAISEKALNLGTETHKFAEDYFNDRSLVPQGKHQEEVAKYIDSLPDNLVLISTELKMYHKKFDFAGTADLVLYDTNTGGIVIADYKTTKDLDKNFNGKKLKAPFNDLLDSPRNKYYLQLALYKMLLEQAKIQVKDIGVVWLKINEDGKSSHEVVKPSDKELESYESELLNYLSTIYKEKAKKKREDAKGELGPERKKLEEYKKRLKEDDETVTIDIIKLINNLRYKANSMYLEDKDEEMHAVKAYEIELSNLLNEYGYDTDALISLLEKQERKYLYGFKETVLTEDGRELTVYANGNAYIGGELLTEDLIAEEGLDRDEVEIKKQEVIDLFSAKKEADQDILKIIEETEKLKFGEGNNHVGNKEKKALEFSVKEKSLKDYSNSLNEYWEKVEKTKSSPGGYQNIDFRTYANNLIAYSKKIQKRLASLEKIPLNDRTEDNNADIIILRQSYKDFNNEYYNLIRQDNCLQRYMGFFISSLNDVEHLLEVGTAQSIEIAEERLKYLEEIHQLYIKREEDNNPANEVFKKIKGLISNVKDVDLKRASDKFLKGVVKEYVYAEKEISSEIKYQNATDEELNEYVEEIIALINNPGKDMGKVAELFHSTSDWEGSPLNKILVERYNRRGSSKLIQEVKDSLISNLKELKSILKVKGLDSDAFVQESTKGEYNLVGKFSEKHTEKLRAIEETQYKINKLSFKGGKTKDQYFQLDHLMTQLFDEIEEDMDFINVGFLPEFYNDPYYKDFVPKAPNTNEYSEELKKRIGEEEYNDLVQSQKEKLYRYRQEVESLQDNIQKKFGKNVDEVRTIVEKAESNNQAFGTYSEMAQYLNIYNKVLATKNPLSLSSGLRTNQKIKYRIYSGKKGFYSNWAALDIGYMTFVPKANNKDFFESKFQHIENDPVLHDVWKNLKRALRFVNKSYRGELVRNDSIPRITKKRKGLGIKENMINAIADVEYKEFKDRELVSGTYTVNDEINNTANTLLRHFYLVHSSKKQDEDLEITLNDLSEDQKMFIYEHLGISEWYIGDNQLDQFRGTLEDIVKNIALKKLQKDQNPDFFESIIHNIEAAERLQAQTELQPVMEFLYDRVKELRRPNETKSTERFLKKNMYDMKYRGPIFSAEQRQAEFRLFYTKHEKEVKRTLEFVKGQLSGFLGTEEDAKARQTIDAIDRYLNSQGRIITIGSLLGNSFLHLERFRAFAWNFASQWANIWMGRNASYQVDGFEWGEGNFAISKEYFSVWLRPFRGAKSKKNHKITDEILTKFDLFQDFFSENFQTKDLKAEGLWKSIQNIATTQTSIVTEAEKIIQIPQVLSVLQDKFITDKKGNSVPVFDRNNLDDPHPAFDIINDQLALKEEFRTEDNQNKWINRKGDQYSYLFGNSGKIARTISKINGDYNKTTTYAMQDGLVGIYFSLFKRFFYRYVLNHFGHVARALKNKKFFEAFKVGAVSALSFGLFIGSWYPFAIGATIYTLAALHNASDRKFLLKDMGDLAVKNLKNLFAASSDNTLLSFFRLPLATALKTAQLLLNMRSVLGKRGHLITNNMINKAAGWNKTDMVLKEDATEKEIEDFNRKQGRLLKENQESLHFLLHLAARNIILFSSIAMIQSLLTDDDDDDEEEIYDAKSFWDKAIDHPKMFMKNVSLGMLQKFIGQLNLYQDGGSLTDMPLPSIIRTLKNFAESIGLTFDDSQTTYKTTGVNRFWDKFFETWQPATLTFRDTASSFPQLHGGFYSSANTQKIQIGPPDIEQNKNNLKSKVNQIKGRINKFPEYQNSTEKDEIKRKISSYFSFSGFSKKAEKEYFDKDGNFIDEDKKKEFFEYFNKHLEKVDRFLKKSDSELKGFVGWK